MTDLKEKNMRIKSLLATTLLLSMSAHATDAERGKELFVQNTAPPCAVCHTYSKAGSNGMVGPNLDDLKPKAEAVRLAVTNGVGIMPAYGEMLSPEDIESLVLFVSQQ